MAEGLRILVEEQLFEDERGALGLPGAMSKLRRGVDLSSEQLSETKAQIEEILASISQLLSEPPSTDLEMESVTFTLTFEASGKVSLLSVVSGDVGSSAGLQLTFKRKRESHG